MQSTETALERYYRARHERYRKLLNWRQQLPQLLEAVKSTLPDAEVYVFGSALTGKLTADSDIDVLIVADRIEKPHKLAAQTEDKLGEPPIFEIHITTRSKLDWYKRHAKELTPVEQLTETPA